MPYTPKTWENKPSTASPINATNLNHMEGGIKTNDNNIIGAQNAILTLQGEMLQAQGDISALETLVDSIFPVDTESGNPTVITDAFGGACKSLKLTLEPVQSGSGTPSPQNVRTISGRTQSIIRRTRINLIEDTITGNIDGSGYVISQSFDLKLAKVYAGMTYTFSINGTAATMDVCAFFTNKPEIGDRSYDNSRILNSSATFVAPIDGYIAIRTSQNTEKAQVESGTTASAYVPYEPFVEEFITRTYGTTIYGGSDDVTGDGATNTRGIAVANDFPSSWYGTSAGGLYWGTLSVANIDITKTAISSMLPYKTSETAWNSPTPCFTMNDAGIKIYVTESTVADFKANYADLQICYTLATPTSIPLTAQNITLLHGDNVLTTDADSIEASYSADIALYIDKKIAEGSQNNRNLSKGGSGDEEVKEEEKKEEIEIKEAEPLTKEVR